MTREIKLSLLLGFALLLFVGVLVSDHLSAARSAGDPTFDQRDRRTASAEADFEPGFGRLAMESVSPASRGPSAGERSILDEVASAGQWLVGETSPPVAAMIEPDESTRQPEPAPAPQESRGEFVMGIPPGGSADPNDANHLRRHYVRPGETLWSITELYYGDPTLHRSLARFNRDRMTPSGQIRRGATLLIPTRERLFGAHDTPPSQPVRTSAPARPVDRGPARYVVKRGDTLSEIAAAQLGSAGRWREILDLNSDQLDEPEDLWVGMALRLPGGDGR
ncbi:MAG: LysM peptidoglycan-binding domain-containing protein [Planctomycetota bacterium]